MFFNIDDGVSLPEMVIGEQGESTLLFLLYFGMSSIYNLFIMYCVANTISPQKTKTFLIDTAWYGLEVYTIIEMSVNRNATLLKETILSKYPWMTLNYWKPQQNTKQPVSYIDIDGKEIENPLKEDMIKVRLVVLEEDAEKVVFRRVIDTSLDNTNDIERATIEETLFKQHQMLDYKFMACTVDDRDSSDVWNILLTDNETYSYYTLGNVLLTKPFLKMYARKHIRGGIRDKFIKMIDDEHYTVNIIDNRVNTLKWTGSGKAIELHKNGPVIIDLVDTTNLTSEMDDKNGEPEILLVEPETKVKTI